MKKTIQQHRQESILNKIMRYEEGMMSRLEWLKLMQVKGWEAKEVTRRNYAAEEKLREELDWRKRNIPFGNPNYPTTKAWLEDKAKLDAGIFKTEYRLEKENSLYDITKTEYDHFKAIQLSEDKATEAMELTYKMEAGTATDEEINEAMQKEFDFAAKYF